MDMLKDRLKLYVIPDLAVGRGRSLDVQARESLDGGATALQLRWKGADQKELLAAATAFRSLTRSSGALFFVNDDLEIARSSGADGIHVGQADNPEAVLERGRAEGLLVGVSVQTVSQALRAESAGASYLGVGAIFPTASKRDAIVTGVKILRDIVCAVQIPVVAIGGLSAENLFLVREAGASGAAVISAVVGALDIRGAAKACRKIWESVPGCS